MSLISEELIFSCFYYNEGKKEWFQKGFQKCKININFGGWYDLIGLMAAQPINLCQVTIEKERVPDDCVAVVQQSIFFIRIFSCIFTPFLFLHIQYLIKKMSQLLQSILDWLRSLFFKVNKKKWFKYDFQIKTIHYIYTHI